MSGVPGGDVELTTEDLRVVAEYAVAAAAPVLPVFEQEHPDDQRPRAAVEAALAFVGGAPRGKLQRTTALDAHRAAREAATDAARHAAMAAGDAAAAAYLHPIARATQVGHILRAATHAALALDGDLGPALRRATPELVDVLRRYPPAPSGRTPVALLMQQLDATLRS